MDPNRLSMPLREMSNRLSLVFMLTLAIALLLLGRAETYVFDRARQVATDMAAPLLELASRPVAATRRLIERTDEYAYVFDENERLREENARLMEWRDVALKLEAKLARYEALLNVQVDPEIKYLSGRVISDNGGPFVETVIVNVGAEKGVKSGQAVIDTEGLVGRVVATGPKASRVLLLTDLNSRIPVTIEPAAYKAILAGDNTDWPRLDYVSNAGSVSPGDRVVTSGDGGLIPPGLPIGLVIQTDDGLLRVQTFAERNRLDFVRLLQYDFPNQIKRQDPPSVLLGPPVKAPPAPPPAQLPTATLPTGRPAAASPARPAAAAPATTAPATTGPAPSAPAANTSAPTAPAPNAEAQRRAALDAAEREATAAANRASAAQRAAPATDEADEGRRED